MGAFCLVENGFLVSHGYVADGMEALQAGPGQTVVLGAVTTGAAAAPATQA